MVMNTIILSMLYFILPFALPWLNIKVTWCRKANPNLTCSQGNYSKVRKGCKWVTQPKGVDGEHEEKEEIVLRNPRMSGVVTQNYMKVKVKVTGHS